MDEHIEKIYSLISKFDTAMLVTHRPDGIDHARPMAIAKVDPNCDVWFFSGGVSEKASEIEGDSKVLLAFQKDHSVYVSLTGRAQLIADSTQLAELWKPAYKVWFPQGLDDPNLSLIRVNAHSAEYWDSTGFTGVQYLFEAAKAFATGTTPKVNEPEQHGKVNLK